MFTSLKTNMSSENQWLEDDSCPFEMFVFLGGVSGISTDTTWMFSVYFFAQKPRQLSLETFRHTETLNLMHMFIAKMGTGRVRVVTKVVAAGIGRYFSSRIRRGPQQMDQLMVNWWVVEPTHLKKICSSHWESFPLEGVKNKKCLKPPPSYLLVWGVWWFVFLGSPYERDCYLRAPWKKTQTTGTQTNNLPLVERMSKWKKKKTERIQACHRKGISSNYDPWGWDVSTINPTRNRVGVWILEENSTKNDWTQRHEATWGWFQ